MYLIRNPQPIRRETPTNSPTGKKWSEHKPDLQEDFHFHCAYCGSYDGFSHTYFEVDHFVPKSLFEKNDNISYCQYDNLVYSCKFCNNTKSSKWPSQDEALHHTNNEGFVDPATSEYDEHLYRQEDGGIMWKTELGKWMATKAFKFDERDYSIKLLWNLNEIRKSIKELKIRLELEQKGSDIYNQINDNLQSYAVNYVDYHEKLIQFYNS